MDAVFEWVKNNFSPYGFFGVLGFLCGGVYILIYCRIKKVSFSDMIYCYVWGGMFCVIGAKLVYLLQAGPKIIENIPSNRELIYPYFVAVMSGGFVFYGGLLGAIAGAYLAAKYFKYDAGKTLSFLMPAMALAHGFARLGCHTVGCCYGVEFHSPFSIKYHDSDYAPNGVDLFPVQLTESICEFVIFIILAFLVYRADEERLRSGDIALLYLAMYGVVRFILEFLRGDDIRGVYGPFSFSQYVSLILLVIAGVLYMRRRHTWIKHQR